MSVHRLSAGAGYQYLLRHTACGDVDRATSTSLTAYYTESGYPPGRWVGTGLAGLTPDGHTPDGRTPVLQIGAVVTEEAMGSLFGSGRHPVTRVPLGRAYPVFRTTTERINDAVAHLPDSMTAQARAAAVERITNVELAKPHRGAVAGFDLTFTAPKSASTLWALAHPQVQDAVAAAHRDAVDQALGFLEDRFLFTRTGTGSVAQVKTRGMIGAAFDHWDTRAGDPNLHTHVVLANKVQAADGKWRSVDSRALHHAVVAVSEVYDNLFADALARRLPIAWAYRHRGERRTPAYEVHGIREDLLAEFSARSTAIEEAMAAVLADFTTRHGRSPNRVEVIRLRQQVTRATRPGKTVRPLSEMLTAWRERATTRTGARPEDLVAAAIADSHTEPLTAGQVSDKLVQAIGRDVLAGTMTRRSTWTTVNLLAETARATRTLRLATPQDRHALHDRVVAAALAECVSLEAPELFTVPAEYTRPDGTSVFTRPGEHRYTATAVLDAEHRLLTACEDTTAPTARRVTTLDVIGRHHDQHTMAPGIPATSPTTTAPGTTRPGVRLAADQAAAVLAVATSGRRLDVLVGPAGTGKTTTLAGLRAAWEATHGTGSVIGLAPSATAAAELASRLGIACENTAKWLHETHGPGHLKRTERREWLHEQRGRVRTEHDPARARTLDTAITALHEERRRWSLHPGQLLIVDEASLAGTFTLDTLTTQARAAGAKVLLVGDHAQLSAVDAGGAFHLLAERGRPTVLTSLWRFEQAWEAAATLALRAGNPRALTTYEQHGRITAGPGEAMLEDAYTAWQNDHENGVASVLLAADAATVTALNTRAHHDRVTDGLVAVSGITRPDGTTIGVGDRVLTRRNDRTLTTTSGAFIRNGDLWDVTATHPDGSLTLTRTTRNHPGDDDAPVPGAAVEQVHLPTGYVTEHVDHGYATTTHRAQGLTVTAAHLLAGPGMTREALYVGMTRGRASNRVYVALDRLDPACDTLPDPHHTPAGRDVLERILSTNGAEVSATATHARNLDEAGSLHRLTPIRDTLTADATARHWDRALPESGLTQAQQADVEASPARDALFAALTRGHHAGHPMTDVLTRLATEPVDDEGGADFAAELTDRVTAWLDAHTPDPRDHEPRHVDGLVDDGDPAAATLTQVDDLIRQRVTALTQIAVLERPAWLTSHGPEPDPGPEHEAWLAGIAARVTRIDTLDPTARAHATLTAAPPWATAPEVPAPERSLTR